MNKYILGTVLSLGIFISPALTHAEGLTTVQANNLIAVVQAGGPSVPASAYANLITAFSNITTVQANSLIVVVQAGGSNVPASAYVNLLISFTGGTTTTPTQISVPTISYINPTSSTVGSTVYVYGLFGSNPYIQFDGKKVDSTKVTNDKITETVLSFVVPSYANTGTHFVQVVGTVGTPSVTLAGPSVTMNVTASATATAPTVTFTASPTSITAGQPSVLTLSTQNATSCSVTGRESNATNSVIGVYPSQTTTYTATCTGTDGSTTKSVTVTMVPATTTSFPLGCSSFSGYSSLNGNACDGLTPPTTSSSLTSTQIASTLSLLTSFGASSAAISNVNTVISGGTVSMTNLAPSNLTSSQVQSILSLLSQFGANSTMLANVNAILSVSSTATAAPTIVITNVQYSPVSPHVNDWITTTVTVTNSGSVDQTTPFRVNVQGTTATVSSLAAHTTTTVTVPNAFTFSYPGTFTLNTGIIDAAGAVAFTNTLTFTSVVTTPAPTVSLTSSPTSVSSGQSPTVTWSSTNATYCTLTTGSIGDYGAGAAPLNGTMTIDPVTSNRTATLTCNGSGGSATKSVTVTVTTPAPTASIQVTNSGSNAIISWNSTNASECSLYDNVGYIIMTGTPQRNIFTGNYAGGSLTASGSNTYNYGCSNSTGITGWKSTSVYFYASGTGVPVQSSQMPKCACDISQSRNCSTNFVSSDQGPVCYEIYNAQTDPLGGPSYMSVPYTRGSGTLGIAPISGTSQTASVLNAVTQLAQNTSASPAQASFSYVWNNDLQIGSLYSDDVTALQTALMNEGVYAGEITGGFYNQTYWAVQAFQEKYGINPTGYVGQITRTKLNTLYSN